MTHHFASGTIMGQSDMQQLVRLGTTARQRRPAADVAAPQTRQPGMPHHHRCRCCAAATPRRQSLSQPQLLEHQAPEWRHVLALDLPWTHLIVQVALACSGACRMCLTGVRQTCCRRSHWHTKKGCAVAAAVSRELRLMLRGHHQPLILCRRHAPRQGADSDYSCQEVTGQQERR